MLKLMYITNQPRIASIAEKAGVDCIFVDMEYIGKSLRQGGMDTVQSHHTIEDIKKIRMVIDKAQLLVRCNPIHGATAEYNSSMDEINQIIEAGADVIMLPYFKTVEEVKTFITLVDGRVKTMLLVETPEAVEIIDEILKIKRIDEMYIGLNDLSLGYQKKFMFELLVDGTVDKLCEKFKQKGIPYGFGGIASLGKGALPSEYVIKEHYRLKSTSAILSRSFCDVREINSASEIKCIFEEGIRCIREYENECENTPYTFAKNHEIVKEKVSMILENIS